MTEARAIFKNTAALAGAMLIERASSVVLILIVSRTHQAAGLGIYSGALAIFAVLAVVAEQGSTSFLVREIARDRSKTNPYFVQLGVLAIVLGLMTMALMQLVLPRLGYSDDLAMSVSVITLAIIPATLNSMHEAIFIAYQRVHFQTYTTLVAALLNTGLSVYLLAAGHGIVSLIIAFVASKCLITICYFFFLNRYILRLHWDFHWSSSVLLARKIKMFALSSILGGLFARPEVIMLTFLRGETQTGYYTAALKLVDLCYLLPDTFMTNIFPALSRSYHHLREKAQLIQEKSIKYLLALSLPLAAAMTVAAEPIIQLMYGPSFHESVLVLRILAWNLPIYCLNGLLWRVLVARGEQSANVRVQVITAVTRLASGYALISGFGILGAAATSVANLLLHNHLLSLYIKRDGTCLRPVLLGWRFAVIALSTGVFMYALIGQIDLWILAPIAAVGYLLLTCLFKAFSGEDLILFWRLIPSWMARKDACETMFRLIQRRS
jgi:O-antigen/teichoic acid export membrane protein